jgi:hypothetical protein
MKTQIFHNAENITFKKSPKKETKILQNIITLQLISSFNTRQNIILKKSSYKNRPMRVIRKVRRLGGREQPVSA